jgi:O-antigen/teichoic acid export membrane protein
VTLSNLVGPLLVHLEKFALASLVSASAVAYYIIPYNIVTRLYIIPSAFTGALFPLFSSLHGIGKREVNVDVNLRVIRYTMMFLTVPVLFFIVFGQDFLQLWMGLEFARESTNALRILAVAILVNSIAWSSYILIHASGRPDIPAKFHIAELLIHLPLTWWTVRSWGVTGAAWAWFIRVSMGTAWVYFASARLFQMKWRQWLQEVLNPALGVLVIGATIIGLLRTSLYNHMSPGAVLWIFGGGFLTLAALSIGRWGLRREELHLLVRALRGSAEG